MTQAPFPFVVGCGRSGTTLLAAMLDSHPDLAVPSESGGMVLQFCHGLPVGDRPDRLEWPAPPAGGPPYEEATVRAMLAELHESHRYRAWGLDDDDLAAAILSAGVGSRTDLIREIYAGYARRLGKSRYGDKTPAHGLHMPRLAELFPEAVFVHVIRDGRDVALSLIEMSWGPDDVAGAARHWADRVSRTRHAGARLRGGRYLEVRYEALISEPATVLAEVAAHAGLPYHGAMLAYGDAAARQLAMSPAPQEDRNLARSLTAGLRDWRTQMDPVDVAVFEDLAGSLLTTLGYPTAAVPDPVGEDPTARHGVGFLAVTAGHTTDAW